ncbi:TonB-dependent receptor domain-containing protein [Ferruginibacter sp.]|uniref:TonB-dependent receptor n=1 Tax=Ferruginibacter sp. TaxID=1940288 RepID=UPI0026581A22|nr:TonB-dependent receptor [Ferruginibacter sp.]
MLLRFISIFLLSFWGTLLTAQNNFKGIVISTQDNQPLAGVTVSVANNPIAITDSIGAFSFSDSNTKAYLVFTYVGYTTFSGSFISDTNNIISLNPAGTFLQTAIVKAFERNTTLQNIPVSVSILSKADLERYGNTSFVQSVNTVPGVKMDERSPGSYRLSIRGNLLRSPFGVRNVKVYWNGMPFTDANGNTYLNQLGFNNVDRIEIIKGPGGSMYGAGTGGVVLLSNGIADKKENSISINTLAGSWGMFETNVGYKKNTDNSTVTFSYAHQQSDGWRYHTNLRRDVANYTSLFTINKKQTISTNIFYSDLYYQTPGGLTNAQMTADPRQSRPASGPFKSAADQQAALFVKTFYAGFAHTYQFNTAWNNTTSIYTSNTRFKNPSILNYQRKTEQGIGGRSITQYHNNHVTVHFGGEYQYGFTSTRTFGNRLGVPDTLQFDDEISATQYNVFLQTDISLAENFIINAGVSYNNYNYGFTRLNQHPVTTINKTFNPVIVPRISLLKKIHKNYSLYATVSKGYSPPTIDEIVPSAGIFNAGLDAEKAVNYELGLRMEPVKNKLFIDAAYYIFYLNNTIVTRRDASGADYFVNTGKTEQHGLELAINYYPVRRSTGFVQSLHLWSNYTKSIARFKEYKQVANDYSGNKLTGTPPNVFLLGTDIVTGTGLYANITYRYTDILPLNDANTFFASQYNLLLGRVGYKKKFCKVLEGEIYIAFDRSFNTPYSLGNDLNAAGSKYFNPSAPENYYSGIKLKFNL